MTHQNDTGEKPQAGDDVAMTIEWAKSMKLLDEHTSNNPYSQRLWSSLIRAAEENAGLRAKVKELESTAQKKIGSEWLQHNQEE